MSAKSLIRSAFNSLGLEISRKKSSHGIEYFHNEEMIQGLKRCRQIAPEIKTIIDVGAAAGSWSLSAFELWPDSSFMLFEPLEERNAELTELDKRFENFHFIPAAAGREKGQVSFYVSGDLDGSGVATGVSNDSNIRNVNVVSIDEEVTRLELKSPYLVKLDTHGFEVPIIEGAQKILPHVSVFIIECYGFQIAEKSLLFWEMCTYMDRLGFRLFNIVDVMNRAKDGAFWQCDAFFLRKDNKIFEYPQYS